MSNNRRIVNNSLLKSSISIKSIQNSVTKFSSGKHDVEYFNPDQNSSGISYWETVEENFFDIAPGAAIGQKWINKKGWTFEISGGVGRFLLNKDEIRPELLLRGGFSIGKRF